MPIVAYRNACFISATRAVWFGSLYKTPACTESHVLECIQRPEMCLVLTVSLWTASTVLGYGWRTTTVQTTSPP
eukprot:5217061-Pyramimonas_sp.AAC.1